MTLLSAHPIANTAHKGHITYGGFRVYAPMRRIAGITSRRFAVDLLVNRDSVTRSWWITSITVGNLTVAVTLKDCSK
jgi:hypothetical protein